MLDRVLETEVMDTYQEAVDYDSIDHSAVNAKFAADLIAAGLVDGEVLDIGTGTALIPIEICKRNHAVRVTATDLAVSMLDLARTNVELARVTGRIRLDRADAKELEYPNDRFACVMSNSIVHHSPAPAKVLAEAVRVLAPGGMIFFRDLARPASDEELTRLVALYTTSDTEQQRKMFAESLHAALTLDEVQTMVAELGSPREAVAMTSDRHWTWVVWKDATGKLTVTPQVHLPADPLLAMATSVAALTEKKPEGEEKDEEIDLDREMTAAELAEAQEYGKRELVCDLVDRAIDFTFLALAAFWWAVPVDAWLAKFGPLANSAALRLAALFGIVYVLHLCASLPLSFYSGYLLEKQYGLSRLSPGRWLWRKMKMDSLAFLFGLAMYQGLFWVIWLAGGYWWLVAAALFFVVSVILGQIAPVVIVPLFFKVEKLEDERLDERLKRLAAGTGLAIEGVYRLGLSVDTAKANAMLAGIGSTRRVLLGDTLLDRFSTEEIEVIFAHEVGHHVHRHIPKLIVLGGILSMTGLWLCDRFLQWSLGAPLDYANFPTSALPLVMLATFVFSMLGEPLMNAISRHFERQCDRYALLRSGNPAAYRAAFRKLARVNKADPAPHWLEVALFHSHPSIAERLALADE